MTLQEEVFARAEELMGELDGREKSLLSALSAVAVTSLTARLRDGIRPEHYREIFVTAACFHAAAALDIVREESRVQEFRAGDLTVKQGASGEGSTPRKLMEAAETMMRPYLKDSFSFAGV